MLFIRALGHLINGAKIRRKIWREGAAIEARSPGGFLYTTGDRGRPYSLTIDEIYAIDWEILEDVHPLKKVLRTYCSEYTPSYIDEIVEAYKKETQE